MNHWETGKGAQHQIDQPGDLPFAVQKLRFQATRDWQYEM